MGKTAIILGATGLTGKILLENLLMDSRYEKVKLFSRSPVGVAHQKIEEHLIDLFELENVSDKFKADEVFCCIGTTKKKTPDKNIYRKIDFGIPLSAAKLAKENGIGTFLVISALGADPTSKIFYNRTKGEMENAVLKMNIPNTFILQPSLITGQRNEKRTLESLAMNSMGLVDKLLIGPLKKYRGIEAETIAEAMIYLANNPINKNRIESDEIKRFAESL